MNYIYLIIFYDFWDALVGIDPPRHLYLTTAEQDVTFDGNTYLSGYIVVDSLGSIEISDDVVTPVTGFQTYLSNVSFRARIRERMGTKKVDVMMVRIKQ